MVDKNMYYNDEKRTDKDMYYSSEARTDKVKS